jgi:hypothetical protein
MNPEAGDRVIHTQTEVVTEADLLSCAKITDEISKRPLGIAYVIALRTIIDSGALPPGAMMLGHSVTWHEAPSAATFRTELRILAADPPRRRYQKVMIGYRTLEASTGRLVLEQEQEVLWPVVA